MQIEPYQDDRLPVLLIGPAGEEDEARRGWAGFGVRVEFVAMHDPAADPAWADEVILGAGAKLPPAEACRTWAHVKAWQRMVQSGWERVLVIQGGAAPTGGPAGLVAELAVLGGEWDFVHLGTGMEDAQKPVPLAEERRGAFIPVSSVGGAVRAYACTRAVAAWGLEAALPIKQTLEDVLCAGLDGARLFQARQELFVGG